MKNEFAFLIAVQMHKYLIQSFILYYYFMALKTKSAKFWFIAATIVVGCMPLLTKIIISRCVLYIQFEFNDKKNNIFRLSNSKKIDDFKSVLGENASYSSKCNYKIGRMEEIRLKITLWNSPFSLYDWKGALWFCEWIELNHPSNNPEAKSKGILYKIYGYIK